MLIIILILLYLITIALYISNIDHLIINTRIIEGNIINLNYMYAHLGDLIFITFYFHKIKDYIEKNNIIIKFYINSIYHNQISEFIQTSNILLYNYKPIGLNLNVFAGIHLLYHESIYYSLNYINRLLEFDKYYIDYFNYISKRIKIPVKVNKFEYKNSSLFLKYNKLAEKYKNLDILIINSIPCSNQFNFDIKEWNNYIIKLQQQNFKIVTTYKVSNINCTLDDNLSLFNIAAISTHSKIIIAINTGPTSTIFNEDTLNYTEKIYLFDNNITYSYDKVINKNNINDIDIQELYLYLSNRVKKD